ncbi:MAG: type II toxin-antitoxin system RelE/ParE family toxin [Kiritimatiellaeota bacterium]|nr:type II toxin-antitoxin system RelE/ParE family toxin [Kiritimatiellota bacterium]
MAQVRWTLQAADDLEAIVEFIATDSPHYAQLLAMDVLRTVERLAVFPRSGRAVPELRDIALREIILGNYRIVYRTKKDLVEILTIYHGARLFDPTRLG